MGPQKGAKIVEVRSQNDSPKRVPKKCSKLNIFWTPECGPSVVNSSKIDDFQVSYFVSLLGVFLGAFWGSWVGTWRSSSRLCYLMRYLGSILSVLCLFWVDSYYFSPSKIIDFHWDGRNL